VSRTTPATQNNSPREKFKIINPIKQTKASDLNSVKPPSRGKQDSLSQNNCNTDEQKQRIVEVSQNNDQKLSRKDEQEEVKMKEAADLGFERPI